MVSSTLRQTVTEWQPVTTMPAVAAGVFLIAGVGIWSFGRNPERTTTWEKLAFLIITVSAIEIVRNSLFLALLAMAVIPVSAGWGSGRAAAGVPREPRAGQRRDRRRCAQRCCWWWLRRRRPCARRPRSKPAHRPRLS